MNIRIKLKPRKHQSNSRSAIRRDILGNTLTQMNYIPMTDDGYYIVYSIQKVRGRTKIEYYKTGKNKGEMKKKTYEPTYYIGHSYRIHPSLLKEAKLKIVRTKSGNKLVSINDLGN